MALMRIYRDAWAEAGHTGKPKLMMAVMMYCHEDRDEAMRIAKPRVEGHFTSIANAMSEYAGIFGHGIRDRGKVPLDARLGDTHGFVTVLVAIHHDCHHKFGFPRMTRFRPGVAIDPHQRHRWR